MSEDDTSVNILCDVVEDWGMSREGRFGVI